MGGHLAERLRELGYAVAGCARRSTDPAVAPVDVTDPGQVRAFFQQHLDADAVVHLAAIAHLPTRVTADDMDRVNHRGVRIVVDQAIAAGIRRFVFCSTQSVYGDLRSETSLTETLTPHPYGTYSTSKLRAEEYCLSRSGTIAPIVLRPPAIYSKCWLLDVRKRAYVPGFSKRLLLRVVGEQPRYSLCAVENAVEALVMAVTGSLPTGVYNVADAPTYSQAEVAEVVGALDDVQRRLPIPRALGVGVAELMRHVPVGPARALEANLRKLFVGQTLSIAKLLGCGYQPRRVLADLLAS